MTFLSNFRFFPPNDIKVGFQGSHSARQQLAFGELRGQKKGHFPLHLPFSASSPLWSRFIYSFQRPFREFLVPGIIKGENCP